MNIQEGLETVNEGTFFVCFCLFWWLVLVALRADSLINLPYWALFVPLWFWKLVVFLGWLIGVISWLRQRRSLSRHSDSMYPYEDRAVPYIQAMSVATFFVLLLCCSEILLCLQLTYPSLQLTYLTILTPLLIIGALGILGFFFVMVDCRSIFSWTRLGRRVQRLGGAPSALGDHITDEFHVGFRSVAAQRMCSFTVELYIAANLFQIIFLIARLDGWIRSKWTVIFIPTFILLGMAFLFCTIGFIVALIRYFTAFFLPIYQRRMSVRYYASHVLINFLSCTSVVFLSLRLDAYLSASQISYCLICTPALLSLVIYAINSFYMGPGNPWWFGLNRNILLTVFQSFPSLQLCANTSVENAMLFWKFPTTNNQECSGLTQSRSQQDDIPESVSDLNSRPTVNSSPNLEHFDASSGPQVPNLYKQPPPTVDTPPSQAQCSDPRLLLQGSTDFPGETESAIHPD